MAVSRQRVWQKRHPEKAAAHAAFSTAVVAGRLERPSVCQGCLSACVPHGHHDDYSKPLSVRWLCLSCHKKAHSNPLSARVVVAVRLEAEQVAAVKTIAAREQRSFGGAVRVLLADALSRRMRRLKRAA